MSIVVVDACCWISAADWLRSIAALLAITSLVVALSAWIWPRTSFWFVSASAVMTAIRSADQRGGAGPLDALESAPRCSA
ncbi:MAG: hypothetical protein PGN13_12435 [Patulibacter minatonensis]